MKTTTKTITLATAALVAVALVVALALGEGGVRSYPEGSPEASMQGFLQDLLDDDVAAAREWLAPDVAARCDARSLRFTPASYQDFARITDVSIAGTDATIEVVFSDEAGLFDDPYQTEHTFGLQHIDGAWSIADLDERFDCT